MGEELLPYFRLAFRELESFALPGVGSFVLRRIPARFSADGSTLEPPKEYYEYQPHADPDLVRQTEKLFAARYSLEPARAADLTEKTGRAVAEVLASGKIISLPSVGTLKNVEGTVTLDVASVDPVFDDLKLAPGSPKPPPTFTAPLPPQSPHGGPGIAEAILADSYVFGPPQPKSNVLVYVFGVLLILGAIGIMTGLFYYNKHRKQTAKKETDEETVAVAVQDTPKVVGVESDSSTKTRPLQNTSPATPPPAPPPTPPSARPPSVPVEKNVSVDDEGGAFHIIVGSAGEWSEASARELIWQKKGFKVELLPGKETGSYRISVGSAPTREAAEKKLATLKTQGRIPQDAWIFKAY